MAKQNGFTLVELAIALMVIGLLISGVLKGQELIENARITRIVKDINDFDTALMIFRSTYNAIPGDMRNPSRLPNCSGSTATCHITETSDRNGNGQVDSVSIIEPQNFWVHLEHAGLLSGVDENTAHTHRSGPKTPSGEWYRFRMFANDITATQYLHRYTITGTSNNSWPCSRNSALDLKMDDGKPWTGRVQMFLSQYMPTDQCTDSTDTSLYATGNGLGGQPFIASNSMN